MAKRRKETSEAVAKSMAKNAKAGGGRLTFNMSPDEMGEWRDLLDQFEEGRGQQKGALMAAIRAGASLRRNDLTNAELIEMLKARMK